MSSRLLLFLGFLSAFLFSALLPVQGQILKNPSSLLMVQRCVDNIYNLDFEKARVDARELRNSYPEHPANDVIAGMLVYWENYPLLPGSKMQKEFESYMTNCIKACEEREVDNDYPEILLSNLGARGLLLQYYADNNLSDRVFPIARTTYRLIRQSFDYVSSYDDFYFFTGLYNYYREAYPEYRPVYKVIAIFFPKGDKARGLIELTKAARSSIILKAESATFLSHIYIDYENNYQLAYAYSKYLNDLYPANLQYLAASIRNLLLLKKYDEAEKLIILSESRQHPFFKAQLEIFKGILFEKSKKDILEAKQSYDKGLSEISQFGYFGNEFAAYACFGLSRIHELEGDKTGRKIYKKKALELSTYKKINFND